MATSRTQKINGVDLIQLQEIIQTIIDDPGMAKFQFRARNKWVSGGHNRTTVKEFFGARSEDTSRPHAFVMEADEPPVLLGEDNGANPVEHLLGALAACLTTSMVYHGAARGFRLSKVESRYDGELDLRGFLGLDDTVPNGYRSIHVSFEIEGERNGKPITATDREELVDLAKARSPVYACIARPVQVRVEPTRLTPPTTRDIPEKRPVA